MATKKPKPPTKTPAKPKPAPVPVKKLTKKEIQQLRGGALALAESDLAPCSSTAVTCTQNSWNGREVSCTP